MLRKLCWVVFLACFFNHGYSNNCTKVAVFNAGLAEIVPKYKQRLRLIPAALDQQDSDVYCLQEIWLEKDMRRITKYLSPKYPYHFSAIHYSQGNIRKPRSKMSFPEQLEFFFTFFSPCSTSELTLFKTDVVPCMISNNCFAILSENKMLGAGCIIQHCGSRLMELRPGCVPCIFGMSTGISDVANACGPGARLNSWNGPGLMLLSKKPMHNLKYTRMGPGNLISFENGYLEADIDGVGKVVCTHLTAVFDIYLEYNSTFSNYQEQQRAEIDIIINQFNSEPHWLMGDLNVGPRIYDLDPEKNLTGEVAHNFQHLMSSGYENQYFSQDGRCTYCDANPLVLNVENSVIDYIMTKGLMPEIRSITRVLDQVSPLPLSDHYGVEAVTCKP